MSKEKTLNERYMDLLGKAIADWPMEYAGTSSYVLKETLGGGRITMQEPGWQMSFSPFWIGRQASVSFYYRGDWVHGMGISVKDWERIETVMRRREAQEEIEAETFAMQKKLEFLEKAGG